MKEIEIVLTEHQILKDKAAKLLIGTVVGFLATVSTEKLYDKIMLARRMKKELQS